MNKNVLLILGNGFDLNCGLKSQYKDFFDWRLTDIFKTADKDKALEKLRIKRLHAPVSRFISFDEQKSLNESSFQTTQNTIPSFDQIRNTYPDITFWDIVFLVSSYYFQNTPHEWQDIEKIIYYTVTFILKDKHNKSEDSHNALKKVNISDYIYTLNKIHRLKHDKESAEFLLDELQKFEKIFAKYITIQLKDEGMNKNFQGEYFQKAKDKIAELLGVAFNNKDNCNVDVFSFNYTLGPRFQDWMNDQAPLNCNFENWNNIHGVAYWDDTNAILAINHNEDMQLPSPIFGIDRQNIKNSQDLRSIFTKSNRILNQNRKIIKNNFEKIDEIIIFGHSLNNADYTYFSTFFNDCHIFENHVVLKFYYYGGKLGNKEENTLQKKDHIKELYDLLCSYSDNSYNHGQDLLTKMITEGRLECVPEFDD